MSRVQDLVSKVERFREYEIQRFWPAVWRRWAIALAFALATTAVAAGTYVWVSRPYSSEVIELRSRVELLDYIAQRVLKMTPDERREFDRLMKLDRAAKKWGDGHCREQLSTVLSGGG